MMFVRILLAIFIGILTTFILTPLLYAWNPVYTPMLNAIPFGTIVVFILNNFNFVVFIAIALYIFKGLREQQTQETYTYGVGYR